LVNIAIMDGTVWRLLNGFKLFREKLDTRRGSNSQLETAVKDLGAVVSFKGYYGDLAIVVASSRYPKHWLTVGDPAREFTMTQSAPLMVLPDPDEFVVVQVK
ncbi:TPA: major capsid protein, partial [Escherichia coli]